MKIEQILEKHPYLKKPIEHLCENRRNEILNQMLVTDSEYARLTKERTKASRELRETLDDTQAELFEQYSDSLHIHEIHEVDALYRQAVCDALELLAESGLI